VRTFFAVIPVALFLALATSHCIRSGVQLDDAGYVAMRVADNIRQGSGIVFNPGERRDLVDSPLWLGCLTVVSFSQHAPLIVQAAGLLFGIMVLGLVLAGPRVPVAGACASLFLGLDGLFASRATSGTSGLLGALYLLTLYIVLRGARNRAAESPHADAQLAGWAAAAALVRYEFVLVAIPATLGWALKERHRMRAWVPLGAAIAGALIVLGLRAAYFGASPAYWEPWPPSAVGIEAAGATLAGLALRRPLLGLGALVMLATWVRGRFRVGRSAGITCGLFLLGAFSLLPAAGHDVERQLEVILPLAYLLAVDAVWRGARTRIGLVAALLLVAAQPAWTWTARTASPESRAAYARLGQWLRTHALPGTVVGARQVGALGYYSQLQVEDVLGQVSPRVATSRHQQTPTPYAVAAVDFVPMLRQEPDLVLVGTAEPVPSAILYVPNLDAIPEAVRGDYGVYRWAGSPVWRDAPVPARGESAMVAPAR
jgi:hypothetical protein